MWGATSRLKKVMGCFSCINTTPNPWPEVSLSMTNYCVKSGGTNTGIVVSVIFSA